MKTIVNILMSAIVSISLFSCRVDKDIEVVGAPAYVQQKVEHVSDEEIQRDAFAQFGIAIHDVVIDIEGGTVFKGGNVVKETLAHGTQANWKLLDITPTKRQKNEYLEKIYNLIKSVSDDGEVHGSNTAGQYHKVYTMRDARANWAWGYKYKNVYLDVYPDVGRKSLGLGISYATQNKTQ